MARGFPPTFLLNCALYENAGHSRIFSRTPFSRTRAQAPRSSPLSLPCKASTMARSSSRQPVSSAYVAPCCAQAAMRVSKYLDTYKARFQPAFLSSCDRSLVSCAPYSPHQLLVRRFVESSPQKFSNPLGRGDVRLMVSNPDLVVAYAASRPPMESPALMASPNMSLQARRSLDKLILQGSFAFHSNMLLHNASSLPSWLPPSPRVYFILLKPGVDPSLYSEDCLYLVAYIPPEVNPLPSPGNAAPVLVWFHGGSYREGSASDPAIEGSNLAKATGSIVVVVQYRLGILGYLPPSAYSNNKNLGVQDAITALQYIRNTVGYVGGDKNKITLAGQSSGGNMIRNLLGAPSASSLFSRAILQSDPMDYGFLSVTTFNTLQSAYYSTVNCGNCLTTPVATLLDAQVPFISDAPSIDPATGAGEPLRPVLDGTLITYSLTTSFPPAWSKNLLLTTTSHEAGQPIYQSIGWALPSAAFDLVAPILYGTPRDAAVKSQYGIADLEVADIRPQLATIGTDGVWRCPNYQFARTWANNGGNIWVGEFTKGATYPDNTGLSYCTADGHVCHEDDIQIVFGTVPSPTAAQTALINQVQARWGAFIKTGNPNTSGYANWTQVPRGGSVPVMNLGGTSSIPLGGCDPAIWGGAI
ncbi:14576_t:CDS:2, partial [Acaulospora colombiana]